MLVSWASVATLLYFTTPAALGFSPSLSLGARHHGELCLKIGDGATPQLAICRNQVNFVCRQLVLYDTIIESTVVNRTGKTALHLQYVSLLQ